MGNICHAICVTICRCPDSDDLPAQIEKRNDMAVFFAGLPDLVGAVTGMQAFILVQWIVAKKEGNAIHTGSLKPTTEWAIVLTYTAMSANLLSLILAQYCTAEIRTGKFRDMKEKVAAVDHQPAKPGVSDEVFKSEEVAAVPAPWTFDLVYVSYQVADLITFFGNLCFFAAMALFLQDQPIPAEFKLPTTVVMCVFGGFAFAVPAVLKFSPGSEPKSQSPSHFIYAATSSTASPTRTTTIATTV